MRHRTEPRPDVRVRAVLSEVFKPGSQVRWCPTACRGANTRHLRDVPLQSRRTTPSRRATSPQSRAARHAASATGAHRTESSCPPTGEGDANDGGLHQRSRRPAYQGGQPTLLPVGDRAQRKWRADGRSGDRAGASRSRRFCFGVEEGRRRSVKVSVARRGQSDAVHEGLRLRWGGVAMAGARARARPSRGRARAPSADRRCAARRAHRTKPPRHRR
jgi:hypothetical protein